MSILWKIHKKARAILPNPIIKKIRYITESYFDSVWSSKVFAAAGEDMALYSLLFRREQKQGKTTLRPHGFYVDVGAFSPKQFSNTYFFYKKGWRGINIDAAPGSMNIFDKIRRRDINIEAAVSDTEAELQFFTWGTPTVVNTLSAGHAKEFAKRIGKPPTVINVRTRTLESILEQFLPPGQEIDFMSIDVENYDINVLQSNNWEKYRPFLVVVELACEFIEEVLDHEITALMNHNGYFLASWIFPNIIFERR